MGSQAADRPLSERNHSPSRRLPVLWRKRHRGAAEGVVVPGMLRVGGGEEAFDVQPGGYAGYKCAGAVEKGEKTVPIDGQEEGMVGGEESSPFGKWNCPVSQAGQRQPHHGIGVREFGNEEELIRSRLRKNVKKVGLEKRLEAAFGGHPDGLGFEEAM